MIHHNFPPGLILAALRHRQEKLYPLSGKSRLPGRPAAPAQELAPRGERNSQSRKQTEAYCPQKEKMPAGLPPLQATAGPADI